VQIAQLWRYIWYANHFTGRALLTARPQDRPPHDGSVQQLILAQLAEARTLGDITAALNAIGTEGRWDRDRAHSWISQLRRRQLVRAVTFIHAQTKRGLRRVALYQRIESA
jgi:hypothetical protein